jgi:hypothetical protein
VDIDPQALAATRRTHSQRVAQVRARMPCRPELRRGPGQHPRRSPDRARAAARRAHARGRPHRAFRDPRVAGARSGARLRADFTIARAASEDGWALLEGTRR